MLLLMHQDRKVAEFDYDGEILKIYDNKLLPLHFKNNRSFEEWVRLRLLDESRVSSRLLKKALRATGYTQKELLMLVKARTITDRYWLKHDSTGIIFEDLLFREDIYSELTLNKNLDMLNIRREFTPELTNTGSYEKGWKYINGKWYLYKLGKPEEIFSEVFTYKLGELLGFDMAVYEAIGDKIRSLDFTNAGELNLQTMSSIVGEDENYSLSYNKLKELDQSLAHKFLDIIYLDTLVRNPDRHTRNYGVLTDSSGDIVKLAPNYDNNLSLIATGYPNNPNRENDLLIKLFLDLDVNYIPPTVDTSDIKLVLDQLDYNVNEDTIIEMIMSAQQAITEKHNVTYSIKGSQLLLKDKSVSLNMLNSHLRDELLRGVRSSKQLTIKLDELNG